jgi:hypothetical protein
MDESVAYRFIEKCVAIGYENNKKPHSQIQSAIIIPATIKIRISSINRLL